mmetsp:Transcript_71015/g.200493  ORF Transcript_71015/g.200493 Transcript_71015/m.200493 type:complete len:443 (+) Transcript_71015:762-2090(+)
MARELHQQHVHRRRRDRRDRPDRLPRPRLPGQRLHRRHPLHPGGPAGVPPGQLRGLQGGRPRRRPGPGGQPPRDEGLRGGGRRRGRRPHVLPDTREARGDGRRPEAARAHAAGRDVPVRRGAGPDPQRRERAADDAEPGGDRRGERRREVDAAGADGRQAEAEPGPRPPREGPGGRRARSLPAVCQTGLGGPAGGSPRPPGEGVRRDRGGPPQVQVARALVRLGAPGAAGPRGPRRRRGQGLHRHRRALGAQEPARGVRGAVEPRPPRPVPGEHAARVHAVALRPGLRRGGAGEGGTATDTERGGGPQAEWAEIREAREACPSDTRKEGAAQRQGDKGVGVRGAVGGPQQREHVGEPGEARAVRRGGHGGGLRRAAVGRLGGGGGAAALDEGDCAAPRALRPLGGRRVPPQGEHALVGPEDQAHVWRRVLDTATRALPRRAH